MAAAATLSSYFFRSDRIGPHQAVCQSFNIQHDFMILNVSIQKTYRSEWFSLVKFSEAATEAAHLICCAFWWWASQSSNPVSVFCSSSSSSCINIFFILARSFSYLGQIAARSQLTDRPTEPHFCFFNLNYLQPTKKNKNWHIFSLFFFLSF